MKNKLTVRINGKPFSDSIGVEADTFTLEMQVGGSVIFTDHETEDTVELKFEEDNA